MPIAVPLTGLARADQPGPHHPVQPEGRPALTPLARVLLSRTQPRRLHGVSPHYFGACFGHAGGRAATWGPPGRGGGDPDPATAPCRGPARTRGAPPPSEST